MILHRALAVPALILAWGLAGCGSSPPVAYYSLDPVAPATARPAHIGPTVQIGTVTLPAMLDREQIVRRDGDQRVAIDDLARWAGPLDDLSRHALARDLALRLPGRTVLTTDDTPPAGPRLVLGLSVDQFDAGPDGGVVLQAHWTVFAGTPLVPTRQGYEDIRQPAAGANVAATMSAAVGTLADRLAGTLP